MTIPKPTDVAFADRNLDPAFNVGDLPAFDMANMPTDASAPSRDKPAVGSEEWHRVRRDNHKEGRSRTCRPRAEADAC